MIPPPVLDLVWVLTGTHSWSLTFGEGGEGPSDSDSDSGGLASGLVLKRKPNAFAHGRDSDSGGPGTPRIRPHQPTISAKDAQRSFELKETLPMAFWRVHNDWWGTIGLLWFFVRNLDPSGRHTVRTRGLVEPIEWPQKKHFGRCLFPPAKGAFIRPRAIIEPDTIFVGEGGGLGKPTFWLCFGNFCTWVSNQLCVCVCVSGRQTTLKPQQ